MPHLISKGLSGDLPTSEYDLLEDGHRIGFGQIRHKPSSAAELPAHMASHLYYEINPDYRGRGYGKELFRLLLEEAKKLGMKEVIATCYEDNLASKKIIESQGGVFIEDALIPVHGKKLRKYRIVLSS